ncbi:MAG: glutamine synthetase III [Nannocystaceae bacterium]
MSNSNGHGNGSALGSAAVATFGHRTFNLATMRSKLPRGVYQAIERTVTTGAKLPPEHADVVAHAMKEWALSHGATHYCHWFQPLTGSTAEKHDAFLNIDRDGTPIDRFTGSQLIQSEPDASSFPSGGMRATFEARGYTAWDPSSPAFLMPGPQGATLCIPSVFISYHGQALDEKTPLLRSVQALSKAAVGLLALLDEEGVKRVTPLLGVEQEYFLVDGDLYARRADLVMARRTLFGALPPKAQQLEDHYFGSIPDRVLDFMQEVERELYALGIPAKTRHNEVAPHQYEIAPIHEEVNLAADHNLLLMEVLWRTAQRKGMALLLHEKPFAGVNGSGKHNNWSCATDTGKNLLEPGETPRSNLSFLVFLICTLKAVHRRGALLRASIASAGNDHRLGANEAPPAIMSVFLGEALDRILNTIETGEDKAVDERPFISLGLAHLPAVARDNTDRNRTSPFAFTGNKFEFRAVPSSMPVAMPNVVLNTAMAEAIDEVAASIRHRVEGGEGLEAAVMAVIRQEIKATKAIRFEGDGYSQEWQREAEARGLPNLKNTPAALDAWRDQGNRDLFTRYGVLRDDEIDARYTVRLEQYVKAIDIEAKTVLRMARTELLPAVLRYQTELTEALAKLHKIRKHLELGDDLEVLTAQVQVTVRDVARLAREADALDQAIHGLHGHATLESEARYCVSALIPAAAAVRECADRLEIRTDRNLWPMPTYLDLLFRH